ncbi:MAG: NAD(+)/NADH kinase [Candidatus Poribacteria bacterium]|nr:NAD(+) kinase [Candidatus Poribacteria bacterium]
MKTIGFFVNTTKEKALEVVPATVAWLREKGVESLIADDEADAVGIRKVGCDRDTVVGRSDLILVLGGDGTLLNAVHTPRIENVPILAVNIGHLGFLTDVSLDELYPALERVLEGNYEIDTRMMLEARLDSTDDQSGVESYFALNDVVIRHNTRLIELETQIDAEPFITYNADGLIMATPSGSTSYSLSSGGAIVEPHLDAILLTPISPHSLTMRPFIAHGDSEIKVTVRSNYGDVNLLVDGPRTMLLVSPGASIRICKADKKIQLIRSQRRSYHEVLRTKLMLGEGIKRSE